MQFTLSKAPLQSGFTLVELMITLAVAAILLSVAVPSFSSFVRSNRAITQTNDLITSLQLARGEAIKSNRRVSICPSSDQSTCNSTNLADGWIVFTDTDSNGARANTETLLRVHEALTNTTATVAGLSTNGYLQYLPTGFISSTTAGTFTLTQTGCTTPGVINIATTGRIARTSSAGNC